VLTFFITLLIFILLIPAGFFILECVGALLPNRRIDYDLTQTRDNISNTIIIPAHNEGASITPTLQNLLHQRRPNDQLIIVADNCTDNTAEIAEQIVADHNNCHILLRHDTERRGKGYALEFGLNHLVENPPDIITFVDADCRASDGALDKIIVAAHQTKRPIQALYLMERPDNSAPAQAIAAFAWMVMNKIRMSGLFNLFDVTRLTGSGMAFPYKIVHDYFSGSGDIVEDLAFTLTLVEKNHPPALIKDARITSQFPAQTKTSTDQRARWEHGSLMTIRRAFLPLFLKAIKTFNIRQLAMALDLLIPPLVLLGTFLITLAIILFIPAFLFNVSSFAPGAWLVFQTGFACALTLIIIWVIAGRSILTSQDIGGIGTFLIQKFSIYGRKGRQSSKTWTRTERDNPSETAAKTTSHPSQDDRPSQSQ